MHPLRQLEDVAVTDVGRPGLHEAHGHRLVLAEPGGEHASGRSSAGDHIVEHGVRHGSSLSASSFVVAACEARHPMWLRPFTAYQRRPSPRMIPM
ncbi:hypothetical protein MLGJGCBP_02213 [Rhodococcus sp. T7]|nr:hypothetical protein MLGJGCBP_02213 [Rhodococcus sp. T7]